MAKLTCPLCGLRIADHATRFGIVCGVCAATMPTICDFCSSTMPVWAYPARDFNAPLMPQHVSRGGWAACDHCHYLISQNLWGELARWSLEHFPDYVHLNAETRRGILVAIERIHILFKDNRLGPARAISTYPPLPPGTDPTLEQP